MNLYEIDNAILNCVDEETGEIVQPEMLNDLEMARDIKVENIACWIKDCLAEAKALKEEKENLNARQKAAEKKAEDLKKYLANYLAGEKFKTARVSVSFRKSKQVIVQDVWKIPEDFRRYSEPTANKEMLKKALVNGEKIVGAKLVENINIQIK